MRILLESDSKFWVIINRKKKFKFNFLLKYLYIYHLI